MDFKKIFHFFDDPCFNIVRLLSLPYFMYLTLHPKISFGKGLVLKGKPIFESIDGGKVEIGDNVTLYSTPRNYFAHLSSSVRMFTEGPNALIKIGNNTRINGATIHAKGLITIGANCLVAANTSIVDSNGHKNCCHSPHERINSKDSSKDIIIEDNVWIGLNCLILKGVKIGEGSIIAAGSIVNSDIPPKSIARGNPANVVKSTSPVPSI